MADVVSETVRSADPDRYLSVLYAPEAKRPALLALYAFNAEVAAVRDRVREPLPGEIRLQWWRDVVSGEGEGGGNPVAEALLRTIRDHALPAAAFENMLEARLFDLYADPMPSRTDLEGYCGETAGALIQLAALVLDAEKAPGVADAAGHGGCVLGISDILHRLPDHRRRGQCFIPRDILAAAGSSPEALAGGDAGPSERGAVAATLALARDHLAAFERAAKGMPAAFRPAFLPLALSSARLDGLGDPAAVLSGTVREVPAWRRHWLMFRRAARGW